MVTYATTASSCCNTCVYSWARYDSRLHHESVVSQVCACCFNVSTITLDVFFRDSSIAWGHLKKKKWLQPSWAISLFEVRWGNQPIFLDRSQQVCRRPPGVRSRIHSVRATRDKTMATRCSGPQISKGPNLQAAIDGLRTHGSKQSLTNKWGY